MITQDRIKELLTYHDGTFTWIASGKLAGNVNKDGYRHIKIDQVVHKAHRLAWLLSYGVLPEMIDHIDRDKDNNRLSNLRSVTKKENFRNTPKRSTNKSGFKGVYRRPDSWVAQTNCDGLRRTVVGFSNPEDAATVYNFLVAARHGEHVFYNTVPQPWLEGTDTRYKK